MPALDGLPVSSIARKKLRVDNMGHDFNRKLHTLCALCNYGGSNSPFFSDPMNGLHFADPPPTPGQLRPPNLRGADPSGIHCSPYAPQ